ncbi:MAG: hypothetical protein J6Y51_07915 [Bacteroidaceae bacterium]|nr:hypothetical protein [Bacteroidaceae bacterium]
MRRIVFVSAIIILLLGGCRKSKTDCISAQMAVDGVSKYCQRGTKRTVPFVPLHSTT